jgi:hypothetical protein
MCISIHDYLKIPVIKNYSASYEMKFSNAVFEMDRRFCIIIV